MPNAQGGATTVLDLGANVDCSAEHLLQFAVMGSALVSLLQGGSEPTWVCSTLAKKSSRAAKSSKKRANCCDLRPTSGDLNFYGNVEGNDIFKGTVDIVVCDGFVGNVALKASEGVAAMVGGLKQEFSRNILTKIAAIVAYPVLKAFMKRMDYRRYNGAALLGLRGLVFKSHGSADVLAFEQALNRAYDAARNNLLDRVRTRIAHAAPLLAARRCASRPAWRRHIDETLFPHYRHRQHLPPRRLTNADLVAELAQRGIETSDEWIVERTGIRRATFADARVGSSDLGLEAARHALEAAGLRAQDIDLIIVATSTPDMVFPSTACILQNKLGANGCPLLMCRRCAAALSMP
jgi:hypothetical protein